MTIEKTADKDKLTLGITGRLDTVSSPLLDDVVANELNDVKILEFDMSHLDYISSAGLRVLLCAQKIMNRNGSMVIKNANETVKEIFEVTGFADIFTIE